MITGAYIAETAGGGGLVATQSPHLPPDALWLRDRYQKIQTPVDDRGLIVVDALIRAVKTYVDSEFDWLTGPLDIHHLYWPEAAYRDCEVSSDGSVPARQFRELAPNKIYVPRSFHEVLHLVTIPPDMPAADVMRYTIDGWRVASHLFASVQKMVRAERLSRHRIERGMLTEHEERVGREYMQEVTMRHFRGVQRHLGALTLVPMDFWPFSPDVRTQIATGHIGDMVRHGWQRQTRAVRLASY